MDEIIPVILPLLNPNEPEALLAALHVQEGQSVQIGDPLCTLETTKSTADVSADANGYVAGLSFQPGQTVQAGARLCFIAPDPRWKPADVGVSQPREGEGLPAGLRITQPALTLAHQLKIDLNQLPQNQLVTEDTLRKLEQPGLIVSPAPGKTDLSDFQGNFDPTAIIVYGAGGHGKTVIELLRAIGTYRLVGIVDDDPDLPGSISGVPILGGADILPRLKSQGVRLAVNAVGGIGNLQVRIGVFRNLADAGFYCPAVAHPRAFLEPSARLSPGVQVFAQAYVGSDAQIGFGSIINTGAIISHDCLLGAYVNISPGAILAGQVQVEESVLIGMGATLNLQVRVGEGARIGNGATVKADVPAGAVVKAGAVWPG